MTTEMPDKTKYPYEILVRNHLESHWSEYFEGWTIYNLENGEVLLLNPSIDQAGLHRVLNRIMDLNLTLIAITQTARNVKVDDLEKGL